MSDRDLLALAEAAGIATRWTDVAGLAHEVAPPTLEALLGALGFATGSTRAMREAEAALRADAAALPPLLTLRCGPDGVAIPGAAPGARYSIAFEHGGRGEGRLEAGWGGEARLPAVHEPGYHLLALDQGEVRLAAAPARCLLPVDIGVARGWGIAVQVPSLRRRGDLGIGDLGGVAALARAAARQGADCLAISPLHALFAARPAHVGPYAPSTRLFLNPLLADPEAALGRLKAPPPSRREAAPLIDWPAAIAARQARLRALFALDPEPAGFRRFRAAMGAALEDHARFEALDAHFPEHDWHRWPEPFRDPRSPEVAAFARDHAAEVAFHAWCQWVADASLADAGRACRDAGMAIGLVADMAVGTDPSGSHAWSRQREILPGLSVGAPPDVFSPLGQDWGLTAFSPRALQAGGFAAFLEVLRAAMRRAGGLRVDHAMGLARLWLVPAGAGPAEGAYLRYPLDDLLRLLALESHRARSVVIGEDLGTLPEGFSERLDGAGLLGMRVLWFERGQDGGFRPPAAWTRRAVAMTTTHDLPTVAGWWRGRDIDWRARLGLLGDKEAAERAQREADRPLLWRALGQATPPPADPRPVVDAALQHVAGAACDLAILPLEDLLALEEQPNLPGTIDQHPNWARRLPGEAATLLDVPEVATRVAAIRAARRGGDAP